MPVFLFNPAFTHLIQPLFHLVLEGGELNASNKLLQNNRTQAKGVSYAINSHRANRQPFNHAHHSTSDLAASKAHPLLLKVFRSLSQLLAVQAEEGFAGAGQPCGCRQIHGRDQLVQYVIVQT
jgi:hypothetical protein